MKLATAQEIKNIDRRAVREFGIPGSVLMESAAAAVLAEMERFFDGLAGVRVGVICGKGNNGGDGFALARRLRVRGVPVRVVLLSPFASVSGDAKLNLSILRKMDVDLRQRADSNALAELIEWSDVIVDAMLGVGFSGRLSGIYAEAAKMINSSGRPVVAVDVPTGVNADTGEVAASAVQADLTVTMVLPKRGLFLFPGASYTGEVRVADIGIPAEIVERESIAVNLLDRALISGELGFRKADAHKGNFGHLLVIAGSLGKAGAAVMAVKGALRAGAGLVTAAVPMGLVSIVQQQVFEAMCFPAVESIDGTLGIGAEEELVKAANALSACAIGPGLTTHYETVQTVRDLVQRIVVPIVIDADGLNALAGSTDILKQRKAPTVITPHPGEMAKLLGVSSADVQRDRIFAASDFAERYGVTVVLKGAGTVIADPSGENFVNTTGNPGMATAGAGDVLAGMIGSFVAQGFCPTMAACIGVYLHGYAGDLAAREMGQAGMIAGDIIDNIPKAIKEIAGTAIK